MQVFFSNGFTNTQKHQQQKTDALANPFCNPRGDVEQQNPSKHETWEQNSQKIVRIQRESGAGARFAFCLAQFPHMVPHMVSYRA